MLKKYFRDIMISLILAFSMALAFFLILNVIDVVNKFNEKLEHRSKIEYKLDKSYVVRNEKINNNMEFVNSVIEIASKFDGIVENNFMSAARLGQSNEGAVDYVYISVKEDLYLENYEKKVISIESTENEDGVYISEVLRDYTEIVDGKEQILINNTYYNVTDFLKDNSTDNEKKVVLFWKNISDEAKRQWIFANISMCVDGNIVRFMSNKEDSINSMESVLNEFRDKGFDVESADVRYRREYDISLQDPNVELVISMTGFLLIFAFISCFYVSDLLINKRKKELIIRKTFGFTLLDIIKVLFVDLLKIGLVASIMAILLQYIY